MPSISLGHADVLSHNWDEYGPPRVAHLPFVSPAVTFFSQPVFNTPQKYIQREGKKIEGNK